MPAQLTYDPTAALNHIPPSRLPELEPRLLAARQELFRDLELFHSGGKVPEEKQPLDAGFIDLPRRLLDEFKSSGPDSLVSAILAAAARLRESVDRVVLLGIGGSYMGARALFEALCDRYHNELSRDQRGGVPRLYFDGNNLDNDVTASLLRLLGSQCRDPDRLEERWAVLVISKSGGTLETAVAFRLFREAMEEYYGAGSERCRQLIVAVTGETGRLRRLCQADGYRHVFPIPEGVGGRYSVFSAVGLLPAAILGLDIELLLQGAADMTDRFRTAPAGSNPALDYTAVCHVLEVDAGLTTRVLSTWGARLEAVGLWYDQLLAESLGKHEAGTTPLTVVNTRDLHSRGQQHQEGTRDKLITNLYAREPSGAAIALPAVAADRDLDELNRHAGKTLPELLAAAVRGTNRAYADDDRPTADLILPKIDEYALGELLQMFMLATVLEGRLIGINPYGQPGVEAYKRKMNEILSRS